MRRGTLGLDLGVYGAPETFLIDKDGIIRHKFVGVIDERVWRGTAGAAVSGTCRRGPAMKRLLSAAVLGAGLAGALLRPQSTLTSLPVRRSVSVYRNLVEELRCPKCQNQNNC